MECKRVKNTKQSREEYLESIWYLQEKDPGPVTLGKIEERKGSPVCAEELRSLMDEDLIVLEGEDLSKDPVDKERTIRLTEKGKERARLLIRSHRLAERLIHDVLGSDYETGACEFEHIIDTGVVNSICTMLGHPRECPHGLPIPEGECCRQSADTVKRAVIPLSEMEVGHSARIAYVYSKSDQQLHIIEGMQIKPGVEIRLHQKYPTYVVEVEDMSIALDEEIASNIQVWKESMEPRRSFQYGRRGEKGRGRKRGFPGRRGEKE